MNMVVDFSELRVKMVDGQLRTTDVTNLPLISAMLEIPRERFVPENRQALAYIDADILLSPAAGRDARYLMEPSPFAKLVQLAEVRATDNVLVVGAATGYSAAVLSRLAAKVVALESDADLAAMAEATLKDLGCDNVTLIRGPLAAGHNDLAPYDVILVEGSVQELPEALLIQLKEGGRLVAIEGSGWAAAARIYTMADGVAASRRAFNAAVKPLPGFERAAAFEF